MKQRELPSGWQWTPIGECCRVVNGTTPSTSVSDNWGGTISWITPTDLGKLKDAEIRASARTITEAGLKSAGLEIVPPGTVVLSSRAPIGHLGIARIPICTNQGCKSLIPSDRIDTGFLYLALRNAVGRLRDLGSGATFAEVSKTQVENFEIPLPPLAEQQRIAQLLKTKLAAVERARQASAVRLAAARELSVAYLREVFESEGVQKWSAIPLGEVMDLRRDVVHPRNKPTGDSVFVGLEHIESGTGKRIGSENVKKENLTGRKPQFYIGDIVYGYLRPYLNKVWVADFDGLCSVDQYVYSTRNHLAETQYVAWFLRSAAYLKRAPISETPGQLPRIRIEEVEATEINLPPLEKQREIASKINKKMRLFDQLKHSIDGELDALQKFPASLLRQAFSGAL